MSKAFQFKKFKVFQKHCAMKVGTDGVLLGAWAKIPNHGQKVLDIGTGTGLLALMLAQRFPNIRVLGIDVDEEAYLQAFFNFKHSPFAERLEIDCVDLRDFASPIKFDGIVSNPPFFTVGVLPENEQRKIARHGIIFSFDLLFEQVAQSLAQKGIFSLIIPYQEVESVLKIAQRYGLYCMEICKIYPNRHKDCKRTMLAFSFEKESTPFFSELTIEEEKRHNYTKQYQELLKDFYLDF